MIGLAIFGDTLSLILSGF